MVILRDDTLIGTFDAVHQLKVQIEKFGSRLPSRISD
jgi:hypothetical protein